MKCKKCGNDVKVKDAKFCPFCGGTIEKEEELAGYTRGQFFSYTGDSEFREAWENVRSMTSDEALAWLREHPPVRFVYGISEEFVIQVNRTSIPTSYPEKMWRKEKIKVMIFLQNTVNCSLVD